MLSRKVARHGIKVIHSIEGADPGEQAGIRAYFPRRGGPEPCLA